MQKFRRDPYAKGVAAGVIGINSHVFTVADAVYIDGNGWLARATTSSKIFGYMIDTITMSSSNQSTAKVKPKVAPALGMQMIYGSDQVAIQTDIGAYADFGTVSTGGFELNLSAGSTGQMFVLGFDPDDEDDDDAILVECAEPQTFGFAQT